MNSDLSIPVEYIQYTLSYLLVKVMVVEEARACLSLTLGRKEGTLQTAHRRVYRIQILKVEI